MRYLKYQIEKDGKDTPLRLAKIEYADVLCAEIEDFCRELKYWEERRANERIDFNWYRSGSALRYQHRKKTEAARRKVREDSDSVVSLLRQTSDGVSPLWDKEKFMLVARDRGYQTESAMINAVMDELNLGRARTKTMLEKGIFTWGQVMCIGARFAMTPKEFCDIFLSGYFTEHGQQYIASYDNLDREFLLTKRAIKPKADSWITEDTADSESGKPVEGEGGE